MSVRDKVNGAYSNAASLPRAVHPFPVGRAFAKNVGYPEDLLNSMPAGSVERFAGVSNVSLFADILERDRILDLGCGAGLDSLIAALRSGSAGAVASIDFSEAMLVQARQAAACAGVKNVVFCRADAERLPIAAASIDVALINGIFNLNRARQAIFSELARVLRPGGRAYAAELVLSRPLPPQKQSESDWFA